jgi:hypothetical protein
MQESRLSDTKIFSVLVSVVLIIMFLAQILQAQMGYPQATGFIPQVISCVPEHPSARHISGHRWQPTLNVEVVPGRDPGRVREYRVFECSLYYYHGHF